MSDVEIDGQFLHLTNTTILDSIIHILLYTSNDDENYLRSIETSSEKMFSFIVSLRDRQFDATVYADRAALLMDLFPTKTQREVGNDIYSLYLHDPISYLWQSCLPNTPNIYKTFECQQCVPTSCPSPININSQLIYRNNFTVLQQALEFYPALKKVPCIKEGCKRTCSVHCHCNFHIFINLKMKIRGRSQKTVQCKLREIPICLTLDMTYRLAGIIAHSQEGFVAYCHGWSESIAWWELYSSHLREVRHPDPCDMIEPYAAIYVVDTKMTE